MAVTDVMYKKDIVMDLATVHESDEFMWLDEDGTSVDCPASVTIAGDVFVWDDGEENREIDCPEFIANMDYHQPTTALEYTDSYNIGSTVKKNRNVVKIFRKSPVKMDDCIRKRIKEIYPSKQASVLIKKKSE